MYPEQWPRVESIFHDALRIPITELDAFVRSECAGDQRLYAEIISLLDSHQKESLLDRGASSIAAGWLLATRQKLPAGSRAGPYTISSEIGRGGMGTVYRAKDTRLDRDVALKFVWETDFGSSERFPHFDREMRAAGALNHPNIITIHDVGSADGLPYIAYEFVDGVTLRERLARGQPDFAEVLDVGLQVAEALAVAHAAGIVHCDIKPENIMIRRDGLVKVLDFGIARLSKSVSAGGAASVSGTPRYMSPEQLRREPADARSDVYSLGLVLHEMATSCRPNSEMTLAQVPSVLHDVVRRSIAADPTERYPSGREMKAALEKLAPGRKHQQRNLQNRLWIGLGALTIVAASVCTFLLSRPAAEPRYYSAVPLTSETGDQICPSFDPGGNRVVFSWDGEKQDNFDIYVKQIGGGAPVRITTNPSPDLSPAWSPDGHWIAFLRFSSLGKADVLLMPSAANGPERRIAETNAPREQFLRKRFLCWSPDGKGLVGPDGISADGTVGLFAISIETGEKHRLTQPPSWDDDLNPAVSPDMKNLVFARYTGEVVSDLYTVDLSAGLEPLGQPRRLTSYYQQTTSPMWAGNGRLLFTRYSANGTPSLWRMNFTTPEHPQPVPVSADNAVWGAISAAGDRLVYTRQDVNKNLWVVETPNSSLRMRNNTILKPWITSSRDQLTPQFSPDGEKVVFQSTRSGSSELWVADRDGSHPHQLTDRRGAVAGFPHWSPDGTKIVFHLRQQNQARIFVVDAQNGRFRCLEQQATNDYSPTWSHDGKWIYFSSQRSGRYQIWRIPAQGGPAIQITKQGGWAPEESADLRYVYYAKWNPAGIWRVPTTGGEEEELVGNVAASGAAYAISRKGIYFMALATAVEPQHLAFLDFATKKQTPIAEIPREVDFGITISPDERMLIYSQIDHRTSDLMLIQNFH